MKKKAKRKSGFTGIITLSFIGTVLWSMLLYYINLPALNVHSTGFWFWILISGLPLVILGFVLREMDFIPLSIAAMAPSVIALAVLLLGGISSSAMFNARTYAGLFQIQEGVWEEDIAEAGSRSNIALMDTATATMIGERQLAELSDVVSRYDISSFTQVNLDGEAKKIAPLQYENFFKWNKFRYDGIPGYVEVDPVNMAAKYVDLGENTIHYSPSECFHNDLARTVRREYPSALIDRYYFELDNEGNPYYVVQTYKANAGLFGAKTVETVLLVDCHNGDITEYLPQDVPEWVDVVYSGNYLCKLYDWAYSYQNGFWNSIASQEGCRETTSDYGYITKGNDIWIYTGITSVVGDSSNIGLLMANERTGEARYYPVGGADEWTAMAAAEGEISNYGYQASFPSVISVNGEPTYIMVLTDGGIVKRYAMVNVRDYSKVAVAETQESTFALYAQIMGMESEVEAPEKAPEQGPEQIPETEEATNLVSIEVVVSEVQFIVSDGNTYVYIKSEDGTVYRSAFDEQFLFIETGTAVTLTVNADQSGSGIIQVY